MLTWTGRRHHARLWLHLDEGQPYDDDSVPDNDQLLAMHDGVGNCRGNANDLRGCAVKMEKREKKGGGCH